MTKHLYKHGANAAAPIPATKLFNLNPIIKNKRSKFNRSTTTKTSFVAGRLIPIYKSEILPGDTVNIDISSIVRTFTPSSAVMDNLFLDIYFFFCPNRLSLPYTGKNADLTINGYSLWKTFMGENTKDTWTAPQFSELIIPQISAPDGGWPIGSLADYLGLPTGIKHYDTIDAIYFNAYATIYNEWFRDQNFQQMVILQATEFNNTITPKSTGNEIQDIAIGLTVAPVQKLPDYFTTALPAPQKGDPVTINLGGLLPVDGIGTAIHSQDTIKLGVNGGQFQTSTPVLAINGPSGANVGNLFTTTQSIQTGAGTNINASNLYADASNATGITINQLREAIAIQKYLEKNARGGTRYNEIILNHWGIQTGDARLQRPELLGAHRELITHHQVPQTSESNTTPQGNITAYGHKAFCCNNKIIKSFTEHGVILGLCCVRQEHSYSQGIDRDFTRKTLFNFYDPLFATLGEQAIYNKEIFADGTAKENDVFGYKPPWNEYRWHKNTVTGLMRPYAKDPSGNTLGLGNWNYSDNYTETPKLSQEWLQETRTNIDRTLAITDQAKIPAYQLYGDFYFNATYTRMMPIEGIPGDMDHNSYEII